MLAADERVVVGVNVGNRVVSMYCVSKERVELMVNVLCELGMDNLCMVSPSMLCCSQSSSFRLFDVCSVRQWGPNIEIPDYTLLLMSQNTHMNKDVNRNKDGNKNRNQYEVVSIKPVVQMDKLTHIYVY